MPPKQQTNPYLLLRTIKPQYADSYSGKLNGSVSRRTLSACLGCSPGTLALLPSPIPSSAVYYATGCVTPHPQHPTRCVPLSLSLCPPLSLAYHRSPLTGYLYNEHAPPDPSPQSGYTTLPISYGSKLNVDPKDWLTISVRPGRTSHNPKSISTFIPPRASSSMACRRALH